MLKNNLYIQINDLIKGNTPITSKPITISNTTNTNPILIDNTSVAVLEPRLKSMDNKISEFENILMNMPNRILSGMDVYAYNNNFIVLAVGRILYNGTIVEYNKNTELSINNNDIHAIIPLNITTPSVKYLIATSTSYIITDTASNTDVLIAKIVINDIDGIIEDRANSDRTNNYIVSGKDLVLSPSFTIDDDTKFALRNVLTELMAENVIGTLRLNDNLTISNQQNSVVLDSTSMKILDDEIRLAEFNKDGVYFYNESQEMLSQYTKDGATIGQIKITPTSLQSLNFKSGSNGFQILSNGNVEFNDIVARGTIIARAGAIGGVTIANQGLYVGVNQFSSASTPFYVDKQGRFSLGDKLSWDGTTLNIVGGLSVDWIDVTDSTGTKPEDNADVTTTAIGAGVVTTGRIELQNNSSVTGAGIRGGGTLGTEIRLWAGSTLASASSAPFRVTHDGALVATSATITGDITATTGSIGGWTIGSILSSGTLHDYVGLGASGDYRIWAGYNNPAGAPFRVKKNGYMFAYSGNIAGWELAEHSLGAGNIELGSTDGFLHIGTDFSFGDIGIQLEYNSGTPRFNMGNATKYVRFDGTNLSWYGTNTSLTDAGVFTATNATITGAITANTGYIGGTSGWVIATKTLTGGATTSTIKLDVDNGIHMGHADFASAPFSVTKGGLLKATSGTVGGITLSASKMYIGTGTFNNSNTAYYVDNTGQFSLKDKLSWNGTTLTINGNITSTSGTIGGWGLGATTLTGTNMVLTNTGNLAAGTGNDIVRISADDATYRLWAGNATAASALFSVTKAGALKAESGTIGGWTIDGTNGIKLGTTNTTRGISTGATAFYAGNATPGSAPFRVDTSGNLVATQATITGAITANTLTANTSGTIAGWDIQTGLLRSVANSTDSRIELNKTLNRVSVFSGTEERVVMGYLSGLPKNDGLGGTWSSSEYGFWAKPSTGLVIDGKVDYQNGNWIVGTHASIQIGKPSYAHATGGIWLGNDSGTYKIDIGTSTNYLRWDGSALNIKGIITADSGTFTGTVNATSGYFGTSSNGWNISSNTITANGTGLIRTSSTTTRAELDSSGLKGYNAGTQRFQISTDGSGWFGASDKISWTNAGVVAIGGWTIATNTISSTGISLNHNATAASANIRLGSATDYNVGTGIWMDGSGRLRLGTITSGASYFLWDGTNISWKGTNTSLTTAGAFTASNATITGVINANTGTIGGASGWTIAAKTLTAGTTTSTIKFDTDVGIHLGHATFASAPFSVTKGGHLKATGAEISGTIQADNIDENYYYIDSSYTSNLNQFFVDNFTYSGGSYLIPSTSKIFFAEGNFVLTADLPISTAITDWYKLSLEFIGKGSSLSKITFGVYQVLIDQFFSFEISDMYLHVGSRNIYNICRYFKMTDCEVRSTSKASRAGDSTDGIISFHTELYGSQLSNNTFYIGYNRACLYHISGTTNSMITNNNFILSHEGTTTTNKIDCVFYFGFYFDNVVIANNRYRNYTGVGYFGIHATYLIRIRGTNTYRSSLTFNNNKIYQLNFYDTSYTYTGIIYDQDIHEPLTQYNSYVITDNSFFQSTCKYFMYVKSAIESIISNNVAISHDIHSFCVNFIDITDATDGLKSTLISNNKLKITTSFLNVTNLENTTIMDNDIIPNTTATVTVTNNTGTNTFIDNIGLDLSGI